jgi:hypothetical protein
MTTEEVLEFTSRLFGISLYPDTMPCKLRQDPEVHMIASYPLEQARVNCDPAEISGFFDRLERHVEGLPSAFVFNFDESGFQDWADRRKRTVSVPATDQKSEIAYIPFIVQPREVRCLSVLQQIGSSCTKN